MPFVLAVEPDARQGVALRRLLRQRVVAECAVVDSKDAAIAAIDQRAPDLILLSALLSPRDEADLLGHLRQIGAPAHLQSLTIPLFAGTSRARSSAAKGGLFTSLRRRKPKAASDGCEGCDPDLFAEQITGYLRDANAAAEAAQQARPPDHVEREPAPPLWSEPAVELVEVEAAALAPISESFVIEAAAPTPVSEPIAELIEIEAAAPTPVGEPIVEDEPIHGAWSLTAPSDHIDEDRAAELPGTAEVSWRDESEPLLLALMEIEPPPAVVEPILVLAEAPASPAVVENTREDERAGLTPEIEVEIVNERAAAADAEPAAEEWLLRTIDRLKRDLRQSRPDVPASTSGSPTRTTHLACTSPAPSPHAVCTSSARVAAWPVFPLPAGHARPHEGARAFPLSMWARAAAECSAATTLPSRTHGEDDWRRLLQDTARNRTPGVIVFGAAPNNHSRSPVRCRIRLRRVPAAKPKRLRNTAAAPRPVIIVSRRALQEIRDARAL